MRARGYAGTALLLFVWCWIKFCCLNLIVGYLPQNISN